MASPRSRHAATATVSLLLAAGALVACEAPAAVAEPSGDLWIVAATWDLDVPAGAALEEYYSSDHGPHGERDAVYVMSLESPNPPGHWDPATYTSTVSDVNSHVVEEIVEEAGAPFTDAELECLQCPAPEVPSAPDRTGHDQLTTCLDMTTGYYVIFERIF